MEHQDSKRTRFIGLRLTVEEYEKLEKRCRATTGRLVSDYVRRVLFHRPITVLQRNASLDDFMAEMILLRAALHQATGQAQNTLSELRLQAYVQGLEGVLTAYEKDQQRLLQIVSQIHHRLDQIADQWLQ